MLTSALLLALAAGPLKPASPEGPIYPATAPSGWLRFAPPSGTGLPVAQDLCDQVTAAEVDGGFCLKGDGTNAFAAATGALVMAEIGSADGGVSAQTVCPSGPDCATKSVILYTGPASGSTGKWGHEATVATAQPSGAVCACWLGTLSGAGTEQNLLSQSESGATISTLWQTNTAGTSVTIYNGGAADRTITGLTNDAYHLICTNTADGTTGQAYLDGAAFGATYTATLTAVTQHWRVSGHGDGSFPLGGSSRTRGAFMLNGTSCGAARIAAIARAVLADVPSSVGSGPSYPLALAGGGGLCCQGAGAGPGCSLLPATRPCVAGGKLRGLATRTNLALRWVELDNGAWASVGTPTMSANAALGPGGTATAELLGDDSAGAFEGKQQTLTTTAGQAYTLSCWARAGSSSKLRLSNDGTTCDKTVTATWARYTCSDASASGVSTVQQVLIGNAVGDTGDVVVTFCQFELGVQASDGIPTTSASATRTNEYPTFTGSSVVTIASAGSFSSDYLPTQGSGEMAGPSAMFGTSARLFYSTGDGFAYMYDGTNNPAQGHGWTTTLVHARSRWSGSEQRFNSGVGADKTGSFDGTMNQSGDLTYCGNQTILAKGAGGWCANLCLDPDPQRCFR